MNPPSCFRWSSPEGDARLEAIIEGAVDKLAAGAAVDIESLAAAHPEYAQQLRELLPMVLTMVDLRGAMADAPSLVAELDRDGNERKLGDFRLIRELGRGGMGTVFEAEQISMGRRVALKVLPFAALADDKAQRRFRNEVRAAAALGHPHIVSVYSVGEERGVVFRRSSPDRLMCRVTASSNSGRIAAYVHLTSANQPEVLIWDVDLAPAE